MAGSNTAIDLSTLAAPSVVEALSFEAILAEMLTDLQARDPAFTAMVESDPAFKILEVAAYRELVIRQRVNDSARQVMLAYASGTNLEHLAALYGVTRKVLTPADDTVYPAVPAVMESDSDLRYRTQLAVEGFSVAGPVGAYLFHAISVNGVKDAAIAGPPVTAPGTVRVTVLSTTGNGAATTELVNAVAAALNEDSVRPLTDNVVVQGATITSYTVIGTLYIFPGPDPLVVKAEATAALQAYVESIHRVGRDVRISAIMAALHRPGVERVALSAPGVIADLEIDAVHAPYCTAITINTAEAE